MLGAAVEGFSRPALMFTRPYWTYFPTVQPVSPFTIEFPCQRSVCARLSL